MIGELWTGVISRCRLGGVHHHYNALKRKKSQMFCLFIGLLACWSPRNISAVVFIKQGKHNGTSGRSWNPEPIIPAYIVYLVN